jgi:membrane peptidoglycan carboxypeptidase
MKYDFLQANVLLCGLYREEYQFMTEGKSSKANSKRNKNLKHFSRIFWTSLKIFLIIVVSVGFFVGGAVTGFVASKVNGMPTPTQEEIRIKVNEGWQVGFAYFDDSTQIGQLRAEENRRIVSLDEMSPYLIDAFIATEDRDFFNHPGVNIKAAFRAVIQNVQAGDIVSGFSTITQQLARNTFLTNAQSLERKVREVFLALRMERALTKEEVLTAYLNKIYFGKDANGSNIYGVEAAAKAYFGIESKDLNLAQASIIAGLPQNPIGYSLYNHLNAAISRQQRVLNYMLNNKFITQAEFEEAMTYDIEANLVRPQLRAYSKYPFLMMDIEDRAAQSLVDIGLYDNKNDAHYAVLSSGVNVYTTIQPELQQIVDTVISNPDNFMKNINYKHPLTGVMLEDAMQEVGVTMVDPDTGAIWALGGGRDFNRSQTNHTRVPRQTGSSMKTIAVYAPAIEKKILMPGTIIDDVPFVRPDPSAKSGVYFPQNWDRKFHGLLTAREALKHSWNIPALKVFEQLSPQVGMNYVEQMGVTTLTSGDKRQLASAIGGLEQGISVEEMIGAYATFANKGVFNDPYLIKKITDADGNILYEHTLDPKPIFTEETSYIVSDMLRTVVRNGTGGRVGAQFGSRDIIGKTGTTNETKDSWFLGYTPDVALGVFIGFDIPYPMPNSEGSRSTTIFNLIMQESFNKFPERFPKDSKFVQPANIVKSQVSSKSGKLATEVAQEAGWVVTDIFVKGTEPMEYCDVVVKADYVEVEGKKYLPSPYTPIENIKSGYFIKRPVPYELPDENQAYRPLDADLELPTEIDPMHTPESMAPPKLTGLRITDHSLSSVTLRWSPSTMTNLSGYILERSDSPSGVFTAAHDGVLVNSDFTDYAVSNAMTYYYRVKAIDDQERTSDPSNVVSIRPGVNPPKVPTNPEISESLMGITLSWELNLSEERVYRYRIYRASSESGPFEYLGATPDNRFTDVSANSFYDFWYYITAENDSGESSKSKTLTLVTSKPIEQTQEPNPNNSNNESDIQDN